MGMQFDFGRNWADFSANVLSREKVAQARREFVALLAPTGGVAGKSFLDIGFGQGLGLLAAAAEGARAVGVDINPTCREVLERNRRFYPELGSHAFPVLTGSILEEETLRKVRAVSPDDGKFDIVLSWGVLHHTGDMRLAILNAVSLVKPRGYFVVALYNRHWSSRSWLTIKYLYCKSPRWLQKLLVGALYPVIYVAKWLVTTRETRKMSRGMDFFYDVVDWVGGYPYEYASRGEVVAQIAPLGFRDIAFIPCHVPTGCNQFVFQRD